MSNKGIEVRNDDRARLLMAVLAASEWPQLEQSQQPHAVHRHGKQTSHFVAQFNGHPAVTSVNRWLGQGVALADLFTAVLHCRWPDMTATTTFPVGAIDEKWLSQLADFYQTTSLDSLWTTHAGTWANVRQELEGILLDSRLLPYMQRLSSRTVDLPVTVVPTIVYPMLAPVTSETASGIYLLLPPAKAWGESPPWPYGEDPGWVIAQSCWALTRTFLRDTLAQMDETKQAVLRHAVVSMCLEQEFDEAEGMAYLVRSKKEHGLPALPLAVASLRDFLAAPVKKPLIELVW